MLELVLGGYSGSGGDGHENRTRATINGTQAFVATDVSSGGVGASYYESGSISQSGSITPVAGGQGAVGYNWYLGSCGGIAGKGGTITAQNPDLIFAYNGDRFTTNDHSATNSSYDASNLINENDQTFVEAFNYAQSGILRAIYCGNTFWNVKPNNNYTYFFNLFGENCENLSSETQALQTDKFKNILVRKESDDVAVLTYSNPSTGNNQGIGSGFGYIEMDNGTFSGN